MKNRLNIWLLMGTIVPLVLHFWPMAYWSWTTLIILRIIPALCAQALLCRVGKRAVIRAIPLWICYIHIMPPHSPYATVWMLFWDYISPFVSCALVYGVFALRKKLR